MASVGGEINLVLASVPLGVPCLLVHLLPCSSSEKQTRLRRGPLVSAVSELRGLGTSLSPARVPDHAELQSSRKSKFLLMQKMLLAI